MDKIFSRESFAKEKLKVSDESVKAFYGYKELLVEWNNKINLTSILESKEIFYKHFVDSLLIMKVTEVNLEGKSMIDVGTGAGFPGLPLAIASVNRNNAISGLPHGPYTVKNLSPVVGKLYKWL